MTDFRYILKPYKGPATRHACPGCGQRHKFSRYVDTATGNELADHVGRCDRESNCGYHLTPKEFFKGNPGKTPEETSLKRAEEAKLESANGPINYLPFELMDKSVSSHQHCNLFPFLSGLFRDDIADQLCEDYFIGSSRNGDTVFWQVDINGNVRQCKVMQYLPDGHRNKQTGVTFVGKKILNDNDANLQQCFFGEYLLSFDHNKRKPVAIVESEKTAAISSVYYPDFVWLATGGKNGAKWTESSVCKAMGGRKVILFPDLGAYDSWKAKGLLMAATAGCNVVVSDILEKNASEEDHSNGLDIADYLLQARDESGLALTDNDYPVIWDYSHKRVLAD